MEDRATLPVQCQCGMVTLNVERRRYDVEKMSEPRETAVRREFFWYLMWRERGLFLRRLCRSTVTRSLGVAYNLQCYMHFSVTVTVTVLFAKPIKLTTIRKNVGLPSDVAFHRSMDHSFAQNLDTFSEILPVTNKLLNFFAATVDQSLVKGKLEGQDDVVDNFHSLVVDSMDQLLEKTVSLIDVPFLFNSRNYLLI